MGYREAVGMKQQVKGKWIIQRYRPKMKEDYWDISGWYNYSAPIVKKAEALELLETHRVVEPEGKFRLRQVTTPTGRRA